MNNGPLSIFSFLAASVRSENSDFGEFDGDIDADSVSLGASDEDSDIEDHQDDDDDDDRNNKNNSSGDNKHKLTRPDSPHKATNHHNMSRETIAARTLPSTTLNHSQASLASSGTVSPSSPHDYKEAKQKHGHDDHHPHDNKKHLHPFKKIASTLEHSVQSLVGRDHNSDHSDEEDSMSDSDNEADGHENELDDALRHSQASINMSRANDLSNKLRQHLGIGEDEELVGGKYSTIPQTFTMLTN